jgi:hypothetical protein
VEEEEGGATTAFVLELWDGLSEYFTHERVNPLLLEQINYW